LKISTEQLLAKLVKFCFLGLLFQTSKALDLFLRDIDQVADNRVQETRLSRADVADDANELTPLDLQIEVFQVDELP